MEKKTYPLGTEFYTLYEEVGQGVSASVHRALCKPFNEIVAIKILDFERENCDLASICREVQTMILVDHPNVLKSHCSFVDGHNLWIVMPFMAGGSCLHILKAAYPGGFEEVVIATILREVLKGIAYLHHHGHIHRDVKAGNILIDTRGAIKLGDFGVSACLFDSGDRQRMRNTFVGTPCWMAPEVMEQLNGYDFKADIWSFAITGLELAHGHAPFSKYPPMKVLMMTLQNAPPGLDYESDRRFSKSFKQMIASCLVKDPSKRPSANKLLKHSFFKQARSNDYISRTLLDGLPVLGDRIKALKRKEEDMLAQKKMPYGEREELSQNEYKRGISGWNFNLDDLKAQASLIQDFDESMSDINEGGSSNSLSTLDVQEKKLQCHSSEVSDSEENGGMQIPPLPPSLFDFKADDLIDGGKNLKNNSIGSCFEHQSLQNSSPCQDDSYDNDSSEELHTENIKFFGSAPNPGQHRRSISSVILQEVRLPQIKLERNETEKSIANSRVAIEMIPQTVDDWFTEAPPKDSKSSANDEEQDEKAKVQVVQQKGRFKVTSENVDIEKAVLSPILQKSHSMQVLSSNSTIALPSNQPMPLSTPQPSSDAIPSNVPALPFSAILSILQSNINQREDIMILMRHASVDPADLAKYAANGGMSASSPDIQTVPKSLTQVSPNVDRLVKPSGLLEELEAAYAKEKQLIGEITELRSKIISSDGEVAMLTSRLQELQRFIKANGLEC